MSEQVLRNGNVMAKKPHQNDHTDRNAGRAGRSINEY